MSADVVVVGSINRDVVARVAQLPVAGETVAAERVDRYPGGKGANQAVAAARLGASVAMIGRVGDDESGQSLRAGLEDEHIDVHHVTTARNLATGTAYITVDGRGDNTIVVARGANAALNTASLDAASDLLTGAKIVLAQLEVPPETVARAFTLAREAGVTTVLNPSPIAALKPELVELADIVVANELEAASVDGAATLVVTRGSLGTVVGDRTFDAFAVDAVDTTAAGDAFCGALVAGLAAGRTIDDAMPFALAAAALSVTRPGAQPSLPTIDEVRAFLEARS